MRAPSIASSATYQTSPSCCSTSTTVACGIATAPWWSLPPTENPQQDDLCLPWRRQSVRPRNRNKFKTSGTAAIFAPRHDRGLPLFPRCRDARPRHGPHRTSRGARSQWRAQCTLRRSADHNRTPARGSLVSTRSRDRGDDPSQCERREASRISFALRAPQGRQRPHDPHPRLAARPVAQLSRGRAFNGRREVQGARDGDAYVRKSALRPQWR